MGNGALVSVAAEAAIPEAGRAPESGARERVAGFDGEGLVGAAAIAGGGRFDLGEADAQARVEREGVAIHDAGDAAGFAFGEVGFSGTAGGERGQSGQRASACYDWIPYPPHVSELRVGMRNRNRVRGGSGGTLASSLWESDPHLSSP